jgi:6-phosphogluconate dehydrogenase
MKLAMIGLGKMGMGLAERLIRHGHRVVGYDLMPEAVVRAQSAGAIPAASIEDAVLKLDSSPRIVWLMVPAGDPVGMILQQLATLLGQGDIIIEGGNSYYKESVERATMLRYKGIYLLDTGVSGGIWGLKNGFNLMVGGDPGAFAAVEPIYRDLAPEGGCGHVGPSGAGHFVKMIHNGIEYGMMQALAEGLELIRAKSEFDVDLAGLTRLWMHGSVIRSWLLELAGNALAEDVDLDWTDAKVTDSGEGRWTVAESIEQAVPLPVITLALQMRFRSRQEDSFAARLLSALRHQFGGHNVRREGGE